MPRLLFLEPTDLPASLYPFSLMREVVDVPVGLLTLRHKWASFQLHTGKGLQNRSYSIRANLFPSAACWKQLMRLKEGQSLVDKSGNWLATAGEIDRFPPGQSSKDGIIYPQAKLIQYPWELLQSLDAGIEMDFQLLTKGRRSQPIAKSNTVIGKHSVFIERGARVAAAFFNTEAGPIYIGKNAIVQEGAMMRGPLLLGDGSLVMMGAKIHGATAIGKGCVVGGEIKRSLIFPYSNKAHDGYMGDSVIGSWCNWGAGTSNSNLKNTAGMIRIQVGKNQMEVGQKCGVFMGDHTRTAINTSLNSGSVFGVSVQLGKEGVASGMIPSFRWMDGKRYRLKEALEHIRSWKSLKGKVLLDAEIDQLKQIYKQDK